MGTVFDKIQNSTESGPLEAASEQVYRRSESEKFALNDPVALPGFSYAPLSSQIQVADLDPDPLDNDPSVRLEVSTEPPPFFLKFGKGETDRLCVFHQADKGIGWVESVDFDKELEAGPPPTLGFTVRSRDKDGKLNLERGTFEINEEGEPINSTFRGETKNLEDMRREYLVAREHRYSLEPADRTAKAEEYRQATEALDVSLSQKRTATGYEFSQRTTERANHALVDGKKVVAADTPLFVSPIGVLSSSANIGFLSNDGDWEASPLSDHQKQYLAIPNNPDKKAWQNPPKGQGELEQQLAALPRDIPVQDRNEVYRPSRSTQAGRTTYTFAHQYKGWRDYRDLNSGLGILHLPESSLPKEISSAYAAAADKGKSGMLVGEWIEHDGKTFAIQWDGKVVFDRGNRKYEVWNPLEAMRATRNASAIRSPQTLEATYQLSLTTVEGAHYEPTNDSMTLDIQTAKVESPALAPIPDQSTIDRTYDQWSTTTEKIPDVIKPARAPEPTKTDVVSKLNTNRQAFRGELSKFLGVSPIADFMNPIQDGKSQRLDPMQLLIPGRNAGGLLFGNLGTRSAPFSVSPHQELRLDTGLSANSDPFSLMGVPASQYAAGPFLRWMASPTTAPTEVSKPLVGPQVAGENGSTATISLSLAPSSEVLRYLNPSETYHLQQEERQSNYERSPSDLVFSRLTASGNPGYVQQNSQFLSRGGVAVVLREGGSTHVVGKGSKFEEVKESPLRSLEDSGDKLFESIDKAKALIAKGKMSEDELKMHTSGTLIDPLNGEKIAWLYQESPDGKSRDRIIVLRLNDMPEIIGPLVASVVQSKSFDQWHEILVPKSGNVSDSTEALSTLRTGDSGFRFNIESRNVRNDRGGRGSDELDSLSIPRLSIRPSDQSSDSPFNRALTTVFPDSVDTRNGGLNIRDCYFIRARVAEDGRVTLETKDFDSAVDPIPGLGTSLLTANPDTTAKSTDLRNRLSVSIPEQVSIPGRWVYDALGETGQSTEGDSSRATPEQKWGSYDPSTVYPRIAVPITSATFSSLSEFPRVGTKTEDKVNSAVAR